MKRLLGGAVLAVGIGAGSLARADEPPPEPSPPAQADAPVPAPAPAPAPVDNRARAQELFDSALADAEAGNFAAACPKFLASQESDPKTSTLLNLGSCYEKNGQTASAWGAFREAQTLARKAARADWEGAARARADALEPRLLKLTIDVPRPNRIPGLVVTRDGSKMPAGEWGVGIPVDPGAHVIRAAAEGHQPWETRVEIGSLLAGNAKTARVRIPLLDPLEPRFAHRPPLPEPDQLPLPLAPAPSWWTPLRTAGVATGAAGAAGVLTSLVLGLVAKGNYDDAHAACTSGTHGCAGGSASRADDAYSLASAATVVFIIGAAAFVTGGSLVLFAPAPAPASAALGTSPLGVRF